ncbi:MAG: 3-isopropylmalate dehydratase small subunit [Stagnimonas sp.]|nr:3-isopropylmalate dehydratase small subunit [Stagnimonas sp.]
MQAFTVLTSKALPLDRANVDTDAIIPKQYLKSIYKSGFGQYLFDDWRYLDAGDLSVPVASRRSNAEFVLNRAIHAGSEVLVARENFGCGSSREHAVWALNDYGFRCVIAPSFADIFYNNCFKNGVLPVMLPADSVDALFQAIAADAELPVTIDLAAQTVRWSKAEAHFAIDAFRKDCLLRGLDEIGLTLQGADAIRTYEAQRAQTAPWLFA